MRPTLKVEPCRLKVCVDKRYGSVDTRYGFVDTSYGFIDTRYGFVDSRYDFRYLENAEKGNRSRSSLQILEHSATHRNTHYSSTSRGYSKICLLEFEERFQHFWKI